MGVYIGFAYADGCVKML